MSLAPNRGYRDGPGTTDFLFWKPTPGKQTLIMGTDGKGQHYWIHG
jgi:hypothetical protein